MSKHCTDLPQPLHIISSETSWRSEVRSKIQQLRDVDRMKSRLVEWKLQKQHVHSFNRPVWKRLGCFLPESLLDDLYSQWHFLTRTNFQTRNVVLRESTYSATLDDDFLFHFQPCRTLVAFHATEVSHTYNYSYHGYRKFWNRKAIPRSDKINEIQQKLESLIRNQTRYNDSAVLIAFWEEYRCLLKFSMKIRVLCVTQKVNEHTRSH